MRAPHSVVGFAALAALAVAACKNETPPPPPGAAPAMMAPAAATGPIVVGEVGSMTGTEATFGTSTDRGVQLAFEEVNARGGIKGRQLKLKAEDDQSRPEEAANAIKSLINRDHVVAVLGEVASTISLAMAPVAQEKKVPMVSPSSTNLKVTKVGDYIFRVCFIDPFQGQVMAHFTKDTLKINKVAILRDTASDYSVGLADAFIQTFKEAGGQVVVDEAYHKGDVDFRAQLTKIKSAGPEAIFVPGYYNDVGLVAKQARELGIPQSVPLLGGDGWDSPALTQLGGPALDGSYFSNHYSVDDKDKRVVDFVAAFEKRFGMKPDGLAAMGYDAAAILANALGRATDLSGPSIRDALASTKDFQGVTGVITINPERNAVKPAVVLKIDQGKYQFVTRVNP
jgi:branched-chain amino acid transport system substrate-binding protein